MATPPQLPPEVDRALARYLEIQQEERRLAQEKAQVRDTLTAFLDAQNWTRRFWYPTVSGQALRVRYNKDVAVEYDAELLRTRLGDRYERILKADPRKIREHLDDIEGHLEPVLGLIGSPHRDRVRSAILAGVAAKEDFEGAYKKTVKYSFAVMRARPEDLPD